MGDDQRFEKWASGILGVVSLLLVLNLARIYVRHSRDSQLRPATKQAGPVQPAHRAGEITWRSVPGTNHIKRARGKNRLEADARETQSAPPKSQRPQRPEEIDRQAKARLRSVHAPIPQPVKTEIKPPPLLKPAAAQPSPAVRELESLGTVERRDGSRQAVVSEGDRVFLVHEGETFDDHYRVLKISASTVQVADLSAAQSAGTQDAAPESALVARRMTVPPVAGARGVPRPETDPESASRPAAPLMAAAHTAPKPFQTDPASPMVPRAAGNGLASHTVKKSAKLPPPAVAPLIPVQQMTQLTQNIPAPAAEPLGYVERPGQPVENIVAEGDEIRLVPERTTVAEESTGESPPSLASAQGVGQQPALQVASRGRLGRGPGIDPARYLPPDVSGLERSGIREVSARASPLNIPPSRAGPTAPRILTFAPFCYVERADGTEEAFVALGDRVYFVHEGEVFAARYRVLKISPFEVDVADQWGQENRSPPIPPPEFAEKGAGPPETVRLANHSPPEPLPWTGIVRSLAVVFSNPDPDANISGSEAPQMGAQKPSGPTLAEFGSSTLSVPVAMSGNPIERLPGLSSAGPNRAIRQAPKPGGGGKSDGSPAELKIGNGVNGSIQGPRLERITPLPPQASRELFLLPGLGLPGALVGKPAGNKRSALQMVGLPSPHDLVEGRAGRRSAAGKSVSQTPVDCIAGLAGFPTAPREGLLLRFSIGDNGCYFPR
jgi:hypothetical protein